MSSLSDGNFKSTVLDSRVRARIKGAKLVEAQIGLWSDFHDCEVLSIMLDRSPFCEGIACDLRAVFYIFDIRHAPSSPERRPAHVEMLFHDIDELRIDGFNHQNPIMGLGLSLALCERLRKERILVEWGRTALPHDVKFRCDSITVVRVIDLDPFRRGLTKSNTGAAPNAGPTTS